MALRLCARYRSAVHRQLDDELASGRTVLLDSNGTLMLSDNAADDRQSETGSALLRREVRQKELLLRLSRDAGTAVGDDDLHDVAFRVKSGADPDFLQHTLLHRFRSIVDQDRKSTRLNSSHIPLSRMPS